MHTLSVQTCARLFGPYICFHYRWEWGLSKGFLAPAPDAAPSSTDTEKEEEENTFQAQTAAEEGGVKVPRFSFCTVCVCACVCLSQFLPCPSCVQVPKRIEVHSIHTYVALYKFLPQEQNDLELQ